VANRDRDGTIDGTDNGEVAANPCVHAAPA